ncbi:MAG: BlaI/MecI/CopY family transcriptional regulator [Deltaproteobacteria bacterium]|nr:BlaI/MecI/CopY family transcriptional regulator [Deltaproteobacteria bacterium]
MGLPILGELETATLEYLWDHGTRDARDVHEAVGAPREITLSTIQSTLERLHRKRLLMRERLGHAYRYAPMLSRMAFRAQAMAEAAGDLKAAESAGVLAAFVDLVARTDRQSLAALAQHIEDAQRALKKRPKGSHGGESA